MTSAPQELMSVSAAGVAAGAAAPHALPMCEARANRALGISGGFLGGIDARPAGVLSRGRMPGTSPGWSPTHERRPDGCAAAMPAAQQRRRYRDAM